MKFGLYKHSKTGNYYYAYETLRNSENPDEVRVGYRALYGEYQRWDRPREMFSQPVVINGLTVNRFQYRGPLPILMKIKLFLVDLFGSEKYLWHR